MGSVHQSGAKKHASAKAKSSPARGRQSMEGMLARVESVRLAQRQEGNFDCFAKAQGGYCDQSGCAYHADCLSLSQRLA